jgi:MFS family permease
MSVADDKAKTPAQPFTEWSGPRDPANPLNWSSGRKIFQTLMVSLIALVSTLASSIITPGFGDIQSDFNVSSEVALLPFVFYTLGLSIGPLVSGPLSESYGRRNVYASATPILAAFLLGAGFSQSIAALIVCRFLAGVAGAPGLTIGGATLSDVWRKEERALPWTVYVTTPFLGPALGYVFITLHSSLVLRPWREVLSEVPLN